MFALARHHDAITHGIHIRDMCNICWILYQWTKVTLLTSSSSTETLFQIPNLVHPYHHTSKVEVPCVIMCIFYFLKHQSPLKGGIWARYIVRACAHATHIEANARYCGKTSMEFYRGATVMYDLETNVATTVQAKRPHHLWTYGRFPCRDHIEQLCGRVARTFIVPAKPGKCSL